MSSWKYGIHNNRSIGFWKSIKLLNVYFIVIISNEFVIKVNDEIW